MASLRLSRLSAAALRSPAFEPAPLRTAARCGVAAPRRADSRCGAAASSLPRRHFAASSPHYKMEIQKVESPGEVAKQAPIHPINKDGKLTVSPAEMGGYAEKKKSCELFFCLRQPDNIRPVEIQ